jgi:MoaA/NifB/PqqE/SkfB family radical SAM enzyme
MTVTFPSFEEKAARSLAAEGIDIFQINLGYRCNLECRHCHVAAGPNRLELMSRPVMAMCLEVLRRYPIPAIDITGEHRKCIRFPLVPREMRRPGPTASN